MLVILAIINYQSYGKDLYRILLSNLSFAKKKIIFATTLLNINRKQ